MKRFKWLAAWLALCLLVFGATWAMAEDETGAPAEAGESMDAPADAPADADESGEAYEEPLIEAVPVEAEVQEITLELGLDEDPPEEEPAEVLELPDAEPNDEGFYFDGPDVCDLERALVPSGRVYPGELVWPLRGTTPLAHLTSHVGWRNAARIHASQGGTWPSWLHHGIDVGHVTTRQIVVAAASGLAYAGSAGGSGNYVVIDHGNGWYTKYQHLSRFAGRVSKGCRGVGVDAGDPIGYVGSSGGDYPVHFHFEIAWSPDGPGGDDRTYQRQTSNRTIRAYSFPQQSVVHLHWAKTWEICTAENQRFVAYARAESPSPTPNATPAMPDPTPAPTVSAAPRDAVPDEVFMEILPAEPEPESEPERARPTAVRVNARFVRLAD